MKTEARELYEQLLAEDYHRIFKLEDLGEGMILFDKRDWLTYSYLVDVRDRYAYEIIGHHTFDWVKDDDINWESLKGMSKYCLFDIRHRYMAFPSMVLPFTNGAASVLWKPGHDDDYKDIFKTKADDITLFGFINRRREVVLPFQIITPSLGYWDMRREAERIVKEQNDAENHCSD